jgi:hypothetical protein
MEQADDRQVVPAVEMGKSRLGRSLALPRRFGWVRSKNPLIKHAVKYGIFSR